MAAGSAAVGADAFVALAVGRGSGAVEVWLVADAGARLHVADAAVAAVGALATRTVDARVAGLADAAHAFALAVHAGRAYTSTTVFTSPAGLALAVHSAELREHALAVTATLAAARLTAVKTKVTIHANALSSVLGRLEAKTLS